MTFSLKEIKELYLWQLADVRKKRSAATSKIDIHSHREYLRKQINTHCCLTTEVEGKTYYQILYTRLPKDLRALRDEWKKRPKRSEPGVINRVKLKVPKDIRLYRRFFRLFLGADLNFPCLTKIENRLVTDRALGASYSEIARAHSGGPNRISLTAGAARGRIYRAYRKIRKDRKEASYVGKTNIN